MIENHSELIKNVSSTSTILPTMDELKTKFPDYDSAMSEILRINRDYLLLQSNFSHLQASFEEVSHKHKSLLAEKENLELLRKQLKEEAQGILKDAQVLRIRNEQIRGSRANSRDSRDDMENSNVSGNNGSSPCVSPTGVGTPTSRGKPTLGPAAKKSFHVSTATQTDSIPVQAKPYVTIRERMIARGEQESASSAHHSANSPSLNSINSNGNPTDEGDETAFQATTFQDFVRMRREIIELRNKVAQLQPQLTPQSMQQYLSPRTVSSNPSTGRMHHSPRGYNNSSNTNNKASIRTVSQQHHDNHHHNQHVHPHQTAGGTIRLISESVSQPSIPQSSISPTNSIINSSNNSNNKSLPNVKSSTHVPSTVHTGESTNTLSMFSQFLPKLSI